MTLFSLKNLEKTFPFALNEKRLGEGGTRALFNVYYIFIIIFEDTEFPYPRSE